MKVKVVSELPTVRGIIPLGQIIDIDPALFKKLQSKVEIVDTADFESAEGDLIPVQDCPPLPNGGRDLPHYCEPGLCWCSEKLPGRDYPAGCVRSKCSYHNNKGEITNE